MNDPLARILARLLLYRRTRRFLGRFRIPRPEHFARLTRDEEIAYIRAIGLLDEAQAALAEYRRIPPTDSEGGTR